MSSESDPEGPIAAQMLSFVMDDPDFESDPDAQRRAVRTDLGTHTASESRASGGWGMAERHRRHENVAGVSRGVSQGSLGEPGGLPRRGLRVPGPGCPCSGEDVVGDLGITAAPLGPSSLWVSPWCGAGAGASLRSHVTGNRGEARRPTCPLLLQGEFPVREDLSDVTDEEATSPVQPPPPPKPPAPSFRLKNDSDLFGLGLEDTGRKESSEEGSCGVTRLPLPPRPAASALVTCTVSQPGAMFLTPSPVPLSLGAPEHRSKVRSTGAQAARPSRGAGSPVPFSVLLGVRLCSDDIPGFQARTRLEGWAAEASDRVATQEAFGGVGSAAASSSGPSVRPCIAGPPWKKLAWSPGC